jgi:hypothetical protein
LTGILGAGYTIFQIPKKIWPPLGKVTERTGEMLENVKKSNGKAVGRGL